MSAGGRRIFWGHSLPQAVARAARHYAVPADRLAYRVHEKRHGFVKHPRAVLIEVDPATPSRGTEPAGAEAAPPSRAAAPRAEAPRSDAGAGSRSAPRPPSSAPPSRPVPPAGQRRGEAAGRAERPARAPEPWDPPDEESLYAAAEAARQIARFAGLDLVPEARIEEDRLELELHGPDAERLAGLGFELLAEIELLLPRAVQSLCGRHVRCRLDAAGLREAREAELRARAREAAERALASGQPELLEPLNPAERRLVHLELADRPGLETESLGSGFLKKIRIAPRPGAE